MAGPATPRPTPTAHYRTPVGLYVSFTPELADAAASRRTAAVAAANGDRGLVARRLDGAVGHVRLADPLRDPVARAERQAVPA